MHSFPMFIRTTGRRVVIAGGGEQAAQKTRLMLKTDATIILAAPDLDPELAALRDAGRITHFTDAVTADVFADTAMVFVATGCPATDACMHALAKAAGATVNVVDQPALCDMTTPSIVDRDPVVVAIGTEGTAPVLGRTIKTEVEQMLDIRIGGFAALAGRLRDAVAARVAKDDRRAFWRWAFTGPAWDAFRRGAERDAAKQLKDAIAKGGAGLDAATGQIALVGAGPGARDLLTLRAVQRLQEADVIFYDRLVDPEVLELARRDAERVYVGKVVGAHAWPQDKICDRIVAEARKGRRVVRLKSGDPMIFGRATEELDAARAASIPVEVVPGISAAMGAASALGQSLTERGVTDTFVMTTGTCRDGDASPDWRAHARPGAALSFYMSVGNADRITAELIAAGMPATQPVSVACNVSKSDERLLRCGLSDLPATLSREAVTGVATILVSWPKTQTLATPVPLKAV